MNYSLATLPTIIFIVGNSIVAVNMLLNIILIKHYGEPILFPHHLRII